ncbi:MAG TPA: V-type ATP synthase subunit D [Clostridiaceae bacterium]|jgi:V/A-type H+-transporting ATPase subunit D|nr:V-type ATP synthase subunit D [Clostridiaceae bacterium]
MDMTLFPTKGNLIIAKNSLALSRQGYELLDKKRNILVHELMGMVDKARKLNEEILDVFEQAYKALQDANVSLGISVVQQIGFAVPEENSIQIREQSIMGVEIPIVTIDRKQMQAGYGFRMTNTALDIARQKFEKAKELSAELAEIENAIYRLATNIRRTLKRTNALKNILIPKYEEITSTITNVLEEKDREEFSRLKMIKRIKEKNS